MHSAVHLRSGFKILQFDLFHMAWKCKSVYVYFPHAENLMGCGNIIIKCTSQ